MYIYVYIYIYIYIYLTNITTKTYGSRKKENLLTIKLV